MWPFSRKPAALAKEDAALLLSNTLTGQKERFVPLKPNQVSMYTCGPTVYSQAHVGNLRAYIFSDTLARTIKEAGYHLRRVTNITDVGHLVGDGDEGEDKMEAGARKEGRTAQDIAEHYTSLFFIDLQALGIDINDISFPRATQYIREQIAMIQALEAKGLTYRTSDGIYFDTGAYPAYGKLGNVAETLSHNAEVHRIAENEEKKHPADFALWKFSPKNSERQQEWNSLWGVGFPGWHIECSAMSKALLGTQLDIHTGGIDHIPVHHNDEIAQSEGVSGKEFARFWIHNAFVTLGVEKLAKSDNRVVYLSQLPEKGIHPLALRYLYLQAHYRSPISFTWEGIEAANEALTRLWKLAAQVASDRAEDSEERHAFIQAMRNDLGSPQAIAILWDALKDEDLTDAQKYGLLQTAEAHLGLSLLTPPLPRTLTLSELPPDVQQIAQDREEARKARDFVKSDELRIHIQKSGYLVEDSPSGPLFTPSPK